MTKLNLKEQLHKGCTVHFRCGGSAVVKSVSDKDSTSPSYRYRIHLEGSRYPIEKLYQEGGTHRGTDVIDAFDIVKIDPAPFKWDDVKRGMAFEYEFSEDIFYFLAESLDYKGNVVGRLGDELLCYAAIDKKHLTRYPEGDIKNDM